MKKGVVSVFIFLICISLVLMLSLSLVSASPLGDFFKKLFGGVQYSPVTEIIYSEDFDDLTNVPNEWVVDSGLNASISNGKLKLYNPKSTTYANAFYEDKGVKLIDIPIKVGYTVSLDIRWDDSSPDLALFSCKIC